MILHRFVNYSPIWILILAQQKIDFKLKAIADLRFVPTEDLKKFPISFSLSNCTYKKHHISTAYNFWAGKIR